MRVFFVFFLKLPPTGETNNSGKFFVVLFLDCQRSGTVECGCHRNDTALLVERQLVDTYLAMDARIVVNEVLVDAVINDVPLVLTGNLEHRVMSSAVDLVLGFLFDHHVIVFVD